MGISNKFHAFYYLIWFFYCADLKLIVKNDNTKIKVENIICEIYLTFHVRLSPCLRVRKVSLSSGCNT